MFFFAGHGIQNKSQNFLMPTDVKAYSLADAVDRSLVEALQSRNLSLGNVLKVTSKLVKQKTGKQLKPIACQPKPNGNMRHEQVLLRGRWYEFNCLKQNLQN